MVAFLKRYRWPILIIIAGALCYRLFFYGDNAARNLAASQGIDRFPYPTDRLGESSGDYVIAEIQAGRIDLALELVRLRRDCVTDEIEGAEACNERIRQLIQNLPGKDKHRILEIFDQYLQFETKMKQNAPENFARLSYAEKYKLLKKYRRDYFGEENAKLIFGVEEARIALQEEQQKFNLPEYSRLPVSERLKLFEERKKEILGPYYQTHIEREPADFKYGNELMLQQSDLLKMPETERSRVTHELRAKYFGQAQADKQDNEEKQQNQAASEANAKMDQFLAAEREYIRNNPTLSTEARLAGIENLRKSILGQ